MFVHHMHVISAKARTEGVKFPRTRVTDGCEWPCGCREWNQGPLGEQLLTTEPSLGPLSRIFK